MQHFYVWNFSKKKRMITIFALAFCTALFLFFKPLHVFQLFVQTEETTFTKGDSNEKALALTFNISWGDEKVYDILKVLKANQTKATFFVSGEWAEKHPQIMEEIAKNKHEIGMLGYRYQNYVNPEMDQIKKDITYAKEIFEKLGLDNIRYIRPPNEPFNKEMTKIAEDLDLEVIHWSIHPQDTENPGVGEIQKSILHNMSKGDIVLLHASDSAKQTASALEETIPKLQEKKVKLKTISELLTGVSMKEKLIE